jgi:hypothetical protein
LQAKHAETQRQLGLAESAERAMRQQLKSAEQAARGVKEEMGRMKILVAQTRAQCANEVRKRERTIEGMKKHVAEGGRARGSGKTVGVLSINVTAGIGAESGAGSAPGTEESGYDLRLETNEFLTDLARGLSEENENMGALVRRTVETLRTLSGYEKEGMQEYGMVVQTENGYENLAAEMDLVIEHLRTLLTNPSFVPLEEVEVREEEIIRLREGWERMESRWREAVQMMDGWRKRMARSGQSVNLEELKMGLRLSPLRSRDEDNTRVLQLSTLVEDGEDDTQADIDAMDDTGVQAPQEVDLDHDSDDSDASLIEDEPLEEQSEDPFNEQHQDASFNTLSSTSPGPPPQLSPLRETTKGNHGASIGSANAFTTIAGENTYDLLQINTPSLQKSKLKPQSHLQLEISPSSALPEEEVVLLKTSSTQKSSPKRPLTQAPAGRCTPTTKLEKETASKLPRPREALPQQSPLTMASIAAKLAATEREADAARVRAKLKAARMKSASNVEALKLMPPASKEGGEVEPSKLARGDQENTSRETRKRKATARHGGRSSRRRSTLSPWELESLIQGNVGKGAE